MLEDAKGDIFILRYISFYLFITIDQLYKLHILDFNLNF
jgi:hypothetical protein